MQPKLSTETEVLKSGPGVYLVRNRTTGLPYEFGSDEAYLLQLMDGERTPEQISLEYQQEFGRDLEERTLLEFVNQLHELGLLDDVNRAEAADPTEVPPETTQTPYPRSSPSDEAAVVRLNRRLDLVGDLMGWSFHPIWIAPALGVALVAAVGLWHHWGRGFEQLHRFSTSYPLAMLPLAIVINVTCVAVPRELLVGAACREFNGWVRDFGAHFIRGVIPWVFCDVGDSLAYMNRRGRWTMLTLRLWIHVSIASAAAIAWMMAPPHSLLATLLLLLSLTATIGLLLRASIFAKNDGYAILAYFLSRDDLQEWALAETRAWVTLRTSPRPCSPGERFWLRTYGLSVFAFRFVFTVGLIGFISWLLVSRLGGVGALICITVLTRWYYDSIRRKFMEFSWIRRLRERHKLLLRWLLRLGILAAIILCGLLPYNYEIGGDCRLVPAHQYGVRAQIADEIVVVHVKEGDWVDPGDPIFSLAVREERASVETTKAALARAEAELDLLYAGAREEEVRIAEQSVAVWRSQNQFDLSELERIRELVRKEVASQQLLDKIRTSQEESARGLQSAMEDLAQIRKGARDEEIEAAEAEVARLRALLTHHREMLALGEITTPVAGRVITSNIQERLGQTVEPGDLLAVLHDTTVLLGEVAAEESAAAQIQVDMPVKLRLRSLDGRLIKGKVRLLSQTAIDDSQFNVDPVRSDREAQFQERMSDKTARRVRVYVELENHEEGLVSGMTGYARIVVRTDVLWRAVARPLLRFFRVEVWSWFP